MAQAAKHPLVASTPSAAVPRPSEPVCDDFSLRIAVGAGGNRALDGVSQGQWVGRLRRISTAKLRYWGLSKLVEDAELLISELVTNALQHGREDDEIEVRLVITCHEVLMAVNVGSDRRPELRVVGANSESGRGLFLVAAYAATWGVSPDGMTTWCTLKVVKERP